MVQYARFILSQATMTARELLPNLGVAILGVMWIPASATDQQTLACRITSPPPLIANHCIIPMQRVDLLMITLRQNVLRSQIQPHAMLRMNALTQLPIPHVLRILLG